MWISLSVCVVVVHNSFRPLPHSSPFSPLPLVNFVFLSPLLFSTLLYSPLIMSGPSPPHPPPSSSSSTSTSTPSRPPSHNTTPIAGSLLSSAAGAGDKPTFTKPKARKPAETETQQNSIVVKNELELFHADIRAGPYNPLKVRRERESPSIFRSTSSYYISK